MEWSNPSDGACVSVCVYLYLWQAKIDQLTTTMHSCRLHNNLNKGTTHSAATIVDP
eukprot:m.136537 g.136537  ORF g.136537 m.136537 type:complete len:56 (-) comp16024_c0_seq9:1101-1268(-)